MKINFQVILLVSMLSMLACNKDEQSESKVDGNEVNPENVEREYHESLASIDTNVTDGIHAYEAAKYIANLPEGEYTIVVCGNLKNYYEAIRQSLKKTKAIINLDLSHTIGLSAIPAVDLHEENAWVNLKSIILPNSVQSIGSGAFRETKILESVTLPKYINKFVGAFNGCPNLVVSVPDDAIYVSSEDGVLYDKNKTKLYFAGCAEGELIVPNTVTYVEYDAFWGAKKLTKVILPNSITSSEGLEFAYCSELVDITLPEEIESIPECVFEHCEKISKIIIPKKVTNIPKYAFANCTNLEELVISSEITSIGEQAFVSCGKLSNFDFSNVKYIGNGAFSSTGLVSVEFSNKIASSVDFVGCKNLKKISFPQDVKLHNLTLSDLENLEIIEMPQSVKMLDLSGLPKVSKIDIPNDVTYLDLGGLSNVSEIDIPNNVTDLQLRGLSISNINIPETVTNVDISNCHNIKSLQILYGKKRYWIQNCSGLEEVEFSEGIQGSEFGEIKKCDNIKTIILPTSMKFFPLSISNNSMSNLEYIKLKSPVPNIILSSDNIYKKVTFMVPKESLENYVAWGKKNGYKIVGY